MDTLRRYRGFVRTALTAGAVMSAIGTGALAIGLATGVVPSSIFGVRELIAVAIRDFGAGAVAGGLFAWFMARGARGQTLSTLSARRVALSGGLATGSVVLLATLAAPGILPIGVVAAATVAAVLGGGVMSAGMLRLARRDPNRLNNPDATSGHLLP